MTDSPDENPLDAVAREFSQVCLSSGTEHALASLIAMQQRQHVRIRVALAHSHPTASPPPPGTPRDVIAMQADMVRALKTAEIRMHECEFWMGEAAAIRQRMTALLGRKAPPAREKVADHE